MKTIYCPACGVICSAEQDRHDPDGIIAICPSGHRWAASIVMDAPESADGTTVIAFQCDGTPAYALPEAKP